MPADNLPLCCYFDIDVPEILPFQLYLIYEQAFVDQSSFAVFDFSDEMQDYLISETIQQERDLTNFCAKPDITEFTAQFSAEQTLCTKQDLIEFVFEQDLQLNIFTVIKLNEFLVELAKKSSFIIRKDNDLFLHEREDEDCN